MADYYLDNADTLFERYTALDFETVHADLMPCLPDTAGAALDVGAGAGRDALALAKRGWEVVAVEPARRLRERVRVTPMGILCSGWMTGFRARLDQIIRSDHPLVRLADAMPWDSIVEQVADLLPPTP